jgi:hypothetical protein
MYLLAPTSPVSNPDIKQAVAECFWKHKKDMDPEAVEKMENTELFFRFLRMTKPNKSAK